MAQAAGVNNSQYRHGLCRTPEYAIWTGIIQRCSNPNRDNYSRYGANGVSICAEWRESFEAFYRHVGPRPSAIHSIDRIDSTRGYEPGNVRWATKAEQNSNRRSNRRITAFGKTQTASEWSRELGIPFETIIGRLKRNWPTELVLSRQRYYGHTPKEVSHGV